MLGSPKPNVEARLRTQGISPESARAQVEKILSSEGFARSERLSRFLRFTVDQALDGKAGELKEYVLALEVFDKDPSFDPRLDTSVRVEARRLRTALVSYYATAGRDDPILIEYPKGSYAPVFQHRQPAGPQQQPLETAAVDGPARSRLPWNGRRAIFYGLPVLLAAIAMFWAVAGKRLWNVREAASSGTPITSIAVLPFVDMSPEKDQEYFCDGLSEELIHALTKLEGLHVVARTSAFQFKQKAPDIRAIGQQLKVGAILEGSVRKEGRKLRITAQLNTTADGYHLWSEVYERDLNDVFLVQEDIARAITKTLKISLAGRTEPLVDRGSDDTEAHNLYLQGRYFWNKFSPKSIKQSIPYFEQAIAKDPKYALAYVGLADAYGVLGYEGAILPAEGSAKRHTYLAKAFELNGNLPEAFISRGMSKAAYDFDWAGAEADFRRGLELNPRDGEAHFRFSTPLSIGGRLDEAREELKLAQKYDPLSPRIRAQFARNSYLARQHGRAIEEATKVLEMDAPFFQVNGALGMAYLEEKNYTLAIVNLEQAVQLSGEAPAQLGQLGYGYAVAGRRKDAEEVLSKLRQLAKRERVSPLSSAEVYVGLGETNRALELLEQAWQQREGRLAWLKVEPKYDPLRGEPRFQNLLKRMNLQ